MKSAKRTRVRERLSQICLADGCIRSTLTSLSVPLMKGSHEPEHKSDKRVWRWGVMKYLNIQGFKAEEASPFCQQTDPLRPGCGPSLWPTTSFTCRSQTIISFLHFWDTTRGKEADDPLQVTCSLTQSTSMRPWSQWELKMCDLITRLPPTDREPKSKAF